MPHPPCREHRNPTAVEFPLRQRRSYSLGVSLPCNIHELVQVPSTNLLIAAKAITSGRHPWQTWVECPWQPKLSQFFWSVAAVPWHHVSVVLCTVCSEGWCCLINWPPAHLSKAQMDQGHILVTKICKDVKMSTGKTRFHFLIAKVKIEAKGPQEHARWAVP